MHVEFKMVPQLSLRGHLFCAIFIFLLIGTRGFKPVVIIHGLFDSPSSLEDLKGFIEKVHPGTEVYMIDMYDNWKSILPLWEQVEGFGQAIGGIMNKSKDGIHMIGFSQGGLIARGVISTLDYHNIDNFISLSAPQMGQYGDTEFLERLFPHVLKENLYKIFYTATGQFFSVANYWNDPHHHDLYLKYCKFLPMVNNEVLTEFSDRFRTNFMKLKKLILIGGPDDGVITPWQSSHFGFYDENEVLLDMKQQYVYKKDMFGLKSLDNKGAIRIFNIPGVQHTKWHGNFSVFEHAILPWLS